MARKKKAAPSPAVQTEVAEVRTRKDAERVIRSISRTCRGPLASGVAEQVAALLAKGKQTEARALDAANRVPCGFDYNEIILSGPLDGQDHEAVCPGCGVESSYRAPYFPELRKTT